jgi:hypothetical protein
MNKKLLYTLATCALVSEVALAETQMAYLPPVPESWNVVVTGTTVEYTSPVNRKTQPTPKTTLRFTYSRKTQGKTAIEVISDYAKNNGCSEPKKQGKSFYTSSCEAISRDVVVVGEPNNMYTIEISGEHGTESSQIVNTYLTSIINGKRTFEDREIGENVSSN